MFGEHPDRFAIVLTSYLVAISQLTQGEKLVTTSLQIKVNNLGWTCRGESEIPFPRLSEGFKRSLRRRVFFFPPLFFFIFSRLRVSIDLLIDLKWPGAEKANFGCIILSPFHYSLTQREMPPAPQNESMPKGCLRTQDSSQALQIWKSNAPMLLGLRWSFFSPESSQNQWRSWTGTSPCSPTDRGSRRCPCANWGTITHPCINGVEDWMFFSPHLYFFFFNLRRHLFPLAIETSIPLFDREHKNKNPHYIRHPGRLGHTAPQASKQLCAYRGSCIKVFSSLLVKSLAAAAEGAALVQLHLENASKLEHFF